MAIADVMNSRDFDAIAGHALALTVSVRANRRGSGSGVILNSKGIVATNAHVAARPELEIGLQDGTAIDGHVVARDPSVDLALVQASQPLASDIILRGSPVRPGEIVISAGNPWGLGPAVAVGVVHNRPNGQGLIAADIRLAPGYSGGPMLDSVGRLVGINAMISGGLGIAVSSDLLQQLLLSVTRPRLGIEVYSAPVSASAGQGVLITAIARPSPAQAAGLLVGDIITGIPGRIVENVTDLMRVLSCEPDPVKLELVRGGELREIQIWRESGLTGSSRAA